jgi:hypothetical protein
VAFSALATTAGCSASPTYSWNFGDGSVASTVQNPSHAYAVSGTFQWQVTATASGVAATRAGSIAVGQATAPVITRVRQLSDPFRIRIDGSGFQVGVAVYIGSRTTPWPDTQRVSSARLILSGTGLSRLFPRGQSLAIRVVNPDGQSASTTFTRR